MNSITYVLFKCLRKAGIIRKRRFRREIVDVQRTYRLPAIGIKILDGKLISEAGSKGKIRQYETLCMFIEHTENYPLHFSDDEAGIMTTKAERIAHRNIDLCPVCVDMNLVS